MRIIKKVPSNLVGDHYLIGELNYKHELLLINDEGIIFQDINNKENKKKKIKKQLNFDQTTIYASSTELLMLTPIRKEGKGYLIIEEFGYPNKITELILSRKELEEYFKPNITTYYHYQKHITNNLPIPSIEEIVKQYKNDISKFIFDNLNFAEKVKNLYESTMYEKDTTNKIKMIKQLIDKAQIDSILPTYNINENLGNIIMIKKEKDLIKICGIEIQFFSENQYKVILKNYPIKTYKSKTFEKTKLLLPYIKI